MAKTLIGDVQSRIAKRCRVISDLEFKALVAKNEARYAEDVGAEATADDLFRKAANYRAQIRPLARDQRLDREIVQALSASIMMSLESAHADGCSLTLPGYTLSKSELEFDAGALEAYF